MYSLIIYITLAGHRPAPPVVPYPMTPACTDPVKCDRNRPVVTFVPRQTQQPRGPRR